MRKGLSRLAALLALLLALGASAQASEGAAEPPSAPAPTQPVAMDVALSPGAPDRAVANAKAAAGVKEDDGKIHGWTLERLPIELEPAPVEEGAVQKRSVRISDGHLNIRAAASTEAEILAGLINGDEVELLGEEGDWSHIRLEDGTEGYARSDYLSEELAVELDPEELVGQMLRVKLRSGHLNVRKAAGMDADIATTLEDGSEVELLDAESEWFRVRLDDGTEGYVRSDYLIKAPEKSAEPKQHVQLSDGHLNVRAAAGMDGEVIAALSNGDEVVFLGVEGEWTKIRMADGTEGYAKSEFLGEIEIEPGAGAQTSAALEIYEYEREADGSLMLLENGEPIPVMPLTADVKPASFRRDKYGNLALDESGNPVPLQYVPWNARLLHASKDAQNPDRRVDVYADFEGDTLYLSQELRLIAVPQCFDGTEYTIRWLRGEDNETWTEIPGALSVNYSLTVDEHIFDGYWRVEAVVRGEAAES